MTPQELKNSILQLAIQGKLVEQRPEEGTAAELLEKIARNGTHKTTGTHRTKSRAAHRALSVSSVSSVPFVTPIPDDEKLFDIPESWEWVRLGDISSQITKGTTPRGGNVSYSDKGVGFLRAENIAGLDVLDKSNLKYIDEKIHLGALRRSILEANDILITIAGTLGRTAIVRDNDLPLNANQAVSMIRLVDAKSVSLKYIVIALNSPMIQRILTKQRKVTAIPNLTLEIIGDCLIPLPPLAEQKRIVAKIEELLPLIDRYEKAWSKLEDFNKRFPVDMQKSLLQMAIQGKLVDQRPEEGTGEELYRKIIAHKKTLFANKKEGKLSKEHIAEDEIPFDIPETWKWVRFGHIMINRDAERIPLSVDERSKLAKKYDYYGASGVIDKVDDFIFDKPLLLIGEDGANLLTRNTPIAFIARGKYWVNNHAHVLDCNSDLVHMEYVMWFINAINLAPYVTGTAQPKMNQQKMNSIPVALPPLAEQKRIVAKLEEILPLCERLKSASNSAVNP